MSALRRVQLIEPQSGTTQSAQYVIGVDESGNPTTADVFVLTAVQCPRNESEYLAELLINHGLEPWQSTSKSRPAILTSEEHTQRVEQFITAIDDTSITWSAAGGYESYSVSQRAATACIVTTKALTASSDDYEGTATMIHDGGENMYGSRQINLCRYATRQFGSGFEDRVCPVYVCSMPGADLTYPEVTTADYISGYVRMNMLNGVQIEDIAPEVHRIDSSWRSTNETPVAFYRLRSTGSLQKDTIRSRVIAWIEGRCLPDGEKITGEKPYEAVIHRLDSTIVQEYLMSI